MNRIQWGTGSPARQGLALLLALLALLTLLLPWGSGDRLPQLRAVTIKTQTAANKMVEEGAVRGIDVSKWQGNIDWAKVAQDNVSFAFIRASYGTESDEKFLTNARAAHQNGIQVGAYHYAHFKDAAAMRAEAAFFISQLKKVDITYPVVLDMEAHRGLSKTKLTELCRDFMDLVKASGYDVLFYSNQDFISRYIALDKLGGYDIWVANYIEQPKNLDFAVWQHTSYGTVQGISGRVDINITAKNLASRRVVYVNREDSNTLKRYLADTYGANLSPDDKIDMKEIGLAIRQGFQIEAVRQFDIDREIDGKPGGLEADLFCQLAYTGDAGGRITTLLQCRLFYRGNYAGPATGQLDEATVEAIRAFQREQGLTVTGLMDFDTWMKILVF